MRFQNILGRFLIGALILGLAVISSIGQYAHAGGNWIPQFPLAKLKGIDTIMVSYMVEDGNKGLLPLYPDKVSPKPQPVTDAVKNLFSQQKWLSVYGEQEIRSELKWKANVVQFVFVVTARQETLNGTSVNLGSMGLHLWTYDPARKERHALSTLPVSFPFVIPDKSVELDPILTKGATFLTAHLPGYFARANKKWNDAPNDPAYPFMEHPYQEKLP